MDASIELKFGFCQMSCKYSSVGDEVLVLFRVKVGLLLVVNFHPRNLDMQGLAKLIEVAGMDYSTRTTWKWLD